MMRALMMVVLTACLSGPVVARPSEQAVAEVPLEFRETLGGRGRHLRFENLMRGEDGNTWPFRAEALYLCDPAGANARAALVLCGASPIGPFRRGMRA